jgi:hypothetical protein
MSRIESFIALIDQTLFGSKKSNELLALWKQVTHFETCQSLVRSGKREGQPCGKPCVKGETHCICHKPRQEKVERIETRTKCTNTFASGKPCTRFCIEDKNVCALHDKPDMEKCSFTLISGSRRGKTCDKTCMAQSKVCSAHSKKMEEKPESPIDTQVSEKSHIEIETCSYMFTKGANKGNTCDKKVSSGTMCITHSK